MYVFICGDSSFGFSQNICLIITRTEDYLQLNNTMICKVTKNIWLPLNFCCYSSKRSIYTSQLIGMKLHSLKVTIFALCLYYIIPHNTKVVKQDLLKNLRNCLYFVRYPKSLHVSPTQSIPHRIILYNAQSSKIDSHSSLTAPTL